MMRNFKNTMLILAIGMLLFMSSCQQPGVDSPGSEYMPDMGHSIAYEANVHSYYFLNTWDSVSVVNSKDMSVPREPVAGTVPRGYAGVFYGQNVQEQDAMMKVLTGQDANAISTPVNGHVPYYYEDTEEERNRAIAEILNNPFPITAEGLERGEELYDVFCAICHGEKGDGAGYLVRDPNPAAGDEGGKYPAAPANFLLDEHVNASNGRYYHAIMYGKNVMGAYKDKISYEERWQVIHYIRSLQASELGADYNEDMNTLNAAYGVPGASIVQLAAYEELSQPAEGEEGGDHHGEEHHGEDHHEGDHHGEDEHHEEGGSSHGHGEEK